MTDVLHLVPRPKQETDESIVRALEDALDRAKRGEIRGIAIAFTFSTPTDEARIAHRYAGGPFFELIRALDALKFHMHRDCYPEAESGP